MATANVQMKLWLPPLTKKTRSLGLKYHILKRLLPTTAQVYPLLLRVVLHGSHGSRFFISKESDNLVQCHCISSQTRNPLFFFQLRTKMTLLEKNGNDSFGVKTTWDFFSYPHFLEECLSFRTIRYCYATLNRVEGGKALIVILFCINDCPGSWRIRLTDPRN